MKTPSPGAALLAAILVFPTARADTYVTNFVGLNGSIGASGVWRNVTTSTDLSVVVALSQIGGEVKAIDAGSQKSVVDNGFQWQDIPAFPPFVPFPIDAFNPNYNGDFINVELAGNSAALVVINFNAFVLDPVLNFTDVDVQTTLLFNQPFTVVGGTSNLSKVGNAVRTTGVNIGVPFDVESAGSLKFSGAHTRIIIAIFNAGPDPEDHDDRTGFCVSTATLPVPLAIFSPNVEIFTTATQLMLTWPANSLTGLRYNLNLSSTWMPVPAADPVGSTYYVAPKSMFGSKVFFQGEY